MNFDRRMISEMLLPHFPEMVDATSDEWHGFLNAQTGLDISVDQPNANAFDAWRKALAAQGFPVWNITPEREARIKEAGAILKERMDEYATLQERILANLKKEAPHVTAAELMKRKGA